MLDPSRITLSIGRTGYDGDTFKREQLMDRYGIQINKTSRNSVLFMTNIGTTSQLGRLPGGSPRQHRPRSSTKTSPR